MGLQAAAAVHSQLCAGSSTPARIVAGVKRHRTTLPARLLLSVLPIHGREAGAILTFLPYLVLLAGYSLPLVPIYM